jgi:hypothetical protein
MVHSMTRFLGVLVALLAVAAPVARAQDAGEITRHAVAAMQRATSATQDDIQNAVVHGIRVINQLDDNGASDRQLTAAAARAKNVIAHEARQGVRLVNAVAARAHEALRRIGADRRYFQIVADARDASHGEIHQAQRRGTAAVQTALDDALDD